MRTADLHTLAGPYALDALPPDEQRFFEAHLATCESCQQEVAELRATATRLADAAAQPPPPYLRDRVLAAVDATRQAPPLPRPAEPAAGRWRQIASAAAVAALITIVGLVGVIVRLENRIDALETQATAVYRVLASGDLRTVELTGEGDARAILAAENGQALLVAEGLPEITDDQTFELWLIDDRGARPAGLFRPDTSGRAVTILSTDVSGAEQIGITIEPAGGSLQPTSDPILLGEV